MEEISIFKCNFCFREWDEFESQRQYRLRKCCVCHDEICKTCFYNNKQKCFSCKLGNTPRFDNKCIMNTHKNIYKKTSHFVDMLENTKNNELHKYTEEQYEADLQKWASDSKYTKGQTNWTEKYAHIFKKFSGEIKEKKIVILPELLENNISIQKTEIMSATPINTDNLGITEMIGIIKTYKN